MSRKQTRDARQNVPPSVRVPQSQTSKNVVLVLVVACLIVAAIFYAWGQGIQQEHAEKVRAEKLEAIVNG